MPAGVSVVGWVPRLVTPSVRATIMFVARVRLTLDAPVAVEFVTVRMPTLGARIFSGRVVMSHGPSTPNN